MRMIYQAINEGTRADENSSWLSEMSTAASINSCGQFHRGNKVKVCTVRISRVFTSPEIDHVGDMV